MKIPSSIIRLSVLAFAVGLASMHTAVAQPRGSWHSERTDRSEIRKQGFHGMHRGMHYRDPGLALLQQSTRLQLNQDQETRILELSQQFRSEMQPLREETMQLMKGLREIRTSKDFNEQALRDAMEALHPLRVEAAVLRASYHEGLNALLEPEQLELRKHRPFGREGFFHRKTERPRDRGERSSRRAGNLRQGFES